MTTLAQELEDLEARRAAGTLSDEDVTLAKDALLRGASRENRQAPTARPPAERSLRGLLFAGVFSNLMFTIVILAMIAAAAYLFVPMVLAIPVMILCVIALPFIWLWEWVCDLFS
ncbi:MAG: hypothetical protein QNI90_05440 [Dinoroseobacter sp.]|nr:hypothetical protein [Dinoroseobacter sp.]